jgi:predicted AAA+ superfamily ATPase
VSKLAPQTILEDNLLLLNRGALAEQYVGQELVAINNYEKGDLYYWCRDAKGSSAEVDYLFNIGSTIYPIEVKSGVTGRMKSIQMFLQEKQLKLGVRISQQPLSLEKNILSVPLYIVHEMSRLLEDI